MCLLVHIEVSDRIEMANMPGLHSRILIKNETSDCTFALEGFAILDADREIKAIALLGITLNLNASLAVLLLNFAFDSCWQSIVVEHAAMAGVRWRPLVQWLTEHIYRDKAINFADRVQNAISDISTSAE